MDNFKEWCMYFIELENKGIGFSVGDMIRKAKELNLPLPKDLRI